MPTVLVSEPRGRPAMRAAVAAALEHLNAHHGGAGNVLLAPLAASFDQFEDYADRAAAFREAVAATAANARRPPLEADA